MSRQRSDNDFGTIFAFIVVAGVVWLAIQLQAPFVITFWGILKIAAVLAAYLLYAYLTYFKEWGSFEWRHSSRLIRIWPIAAMFIYLASMGMIDHAGTVEFMGIFERERLSYGDTKVPWYSLWYVKLLIALSIVVLGNIFHHIFVYLWKKLMD
ncbi:hypothetical protein ACVO8F_000352 [Vibrio cholerae]|nr:hypothetical protein [Vibrio cholerae]ELU8570812.1 hypothetical protein [Vibrio cholerae]